MHGGAFSPVWEGRATAWPSSWSQTDVGKVQSIYRVQDEDWDGDEVVEYDALQEAPSVGPARSTDNPTRSNSDATDMLVAMRQPEGTLGDSDTALGIAPPRSSELQPLPNGAPAPSNKEFEMVSARQPRPLLQRMFLAALPAISVPVHKEFHISRRHVTCLSQPQGQADLTEASSPPRRSSWPTTPSIVYPRRFRGRGRRSRLRRMRSRPA